MGNVSKPDMSPESSDDAPSTPVLSTGEISVPIPTSTQTSWGSNNPYISHVNPSSPSLPASNVTSSSESVPTLPAPAIDLLGQISTSPTNSPPLLPSTPQLSPGEPAPTLSAPALDLVGQIVSSPTSTPSLPKTPLLGPTPFPESSMGILPPLDIDDSNSSPGTMVSFRPEQPPFGDPETPLELSAIHSEDEDNGIDETIDDELGPKAEDQNDSSSSDAGDLTNLSPQSPSSPNRSANSSPTSDTFNPNACNVPDCGVDEPHDIGPYVYYQPLPNWLCEPYPWGDTLPPPGAFTAHWLTTLFHKPAGWRDYSIHRRRDDESPMERDNRDLVANFMAHHGDWGESFEEEIAKFDSWDDQQDWIKFCAWREDRKSGVVW